MAVLFAIVLPLLAAAITVDAGDTVMTAICNGKMKVYLDGVLQNPVSDGDVCSCWKTPSSFIIPGNTQVVGVECENTEGWGGILASFLSGRGTDRTWQCSDVSFETGMAPASVIGSNGIHWEEVSTISPSAEWIWTPNFKHDVTRSNRAFCKGSLSVPETGIGSCPEDFTYDANTDFCFKVVLARVTWVQAEYLCRQLGRDIHLATPDTQQKIDLLGRYLPGEPEAGYFIGMIEMAEGQWFWAATGGAINQPNWWRPHQPSNSGGVENAGEMISSAADSPSQGLNDVPCDMRRQGYVCEWRPN